jgi:hypothetical protein
MMSCRICGQAIGPAVPSVLDPQLSFDGAQGRLHTYCQLSDHTARVEARCAELERTLELILARLAVPAARAYSSKPSAVRMRRKLGYGEFARQHVDAEERSSPSEKARQVSVNKLHSPSLVVPTAKLPVHGDQSARALEIPRPWFVQLYEHFRSEYRSCIGEAWYRREDVPHEEKRHARELLLLAGSPRAATKAVDRYVKLWRDDEWTRQHRRLTLRQVLATYDKIRIAPKSGRAYIPHPRRPRRKKPSVPESLPPPAPPRVIERGAASVGAVLRRLKAKGIGAVAR